MCIWNKKYDINKYTSITNKFLIKKSRKKSKIISVIIQWIQISSRSHYSWIYYSFVKNTHDNNSFPFNFRLFDILYCVRHSLYCIYLYLSYRYLFIAFYCKHMKKISIDLKSFKRMKFHMDKLNLFSHIFPFNVYCVWTTVYLHFQWN